MCVGLHIYCATLEWCLNGRDAVSNHQPRHCLRNRLSRRRLKKTSKLPVTGLCVGNSPVTGEFPAQMASNTEIFPFDDVIMNQNPPWFHLLCCPVNTISCHIWQCYSGPLWCNILIRINASFSIIPGLAYGGMSTIIWSLFGTFSIS